VIIDGGLYHSLAIKEDGTVWSWGHNSYGQIGDGTATSKKYATQTKNLTDAVSISAGSYHSVAVKSDRTAWAWGYNRYGQLGDGTITARKTPVQVTGISGVVAVAAGGNHTLGLKSDGTVWAWGLNNYGQLGDGTVTLRKTPVQVSGLSNVVAVTAGNYFSVALKDDGTVWAWGLNNYGQLGDGTVTRQKIPVQVSGLSNVTAIAAGYYHVLAVKDDGTAWAWGLNKYGQIGDNTVTLRKIPVQVNGLTDISAIAAGMYHSIAVKEDGTTLAWGYNGHGELGNGTVTVRKAPVQVTGLTNGVLAGTGAYHSIVLRNDDTLAAFGYNRYGQLGDGTIILKKVATQVVGLKIVAPNDVIPDDPGIDPGTDPETDPGTDPGTDPDLDLINAQNAVAQAEALAEAGLSTQVLIDADQQAYDTALLLVNVLSDGTDKADLLNRLAVVLQKINNARAILNATAKVQEAEALAAGDLSTQALIDAAQGVKNAAQGLVNGLSESSVKVELQARLDAVQAKINTAQDILNATLKVEKAESLANGDLNTQALIDNARGAFEDALAAVNGLEDGTVKTDLLTRLAGIPEKLLEAQAVFDVTIAEQTKLQRDIDRARASVAKLPDGDLKKALTARLDVLQKVVDATALLNAIINSRLTTFEQIDKALANLDLAKTIIDSLPNNTDKAALTSLYQQAEAKILNDLLALLGQKGKGKPIRLSDRSLELLVKYAIQKVGAVSTLDRGKVMGFVMPIVNNSATGAQVNQIIDRLLPKK
jgi:hypothetical protein